MPKFRLVLCLKGELHTIHEQDFFFTHGQAYHMLDYKVQQITSCIFCHCMFTRLYKKMMVNHIYNLQNVDQDYICLRENSIQ